MSKKIFGIKISTYLQLFVCFFVAFCIWFFENYVEVAENNETVENDFSYIEYL